jgi:hypothetical protein
MLSLRLLLLAALMADPDEAPRPIAVTPPAEATAPAASTESAARPATHGLAPFRFQLDARLGLGVMNVPADSAHLVGGTSLPLVLSTGLSLTSALVAFAELSESHMLFFDTLSSHGTTVFDLYGAGLGLKYYLTPGYFISGSASIARLQFKGGEQAMGISHWGPKARISTGHEWPVSPTWSIGIAGDYQLGSMVSGALARGYPTDPPERGYRFTELSLLVLASFHQAETPAPGNPVPTASPSPSRLYLDAQVGMGRLWPKVGNPFWMTGTSIPLALSAGIRLTKYLIVVGQLSDIHMFNPSVFGDSSRLYSLDLYGVGLGLKCYLTPRAWFLSASASLAQLRIEGFNYSESRFSETSRWGVLTRMALGREWPISPSWSLGAAGEVQWGTMAVGDGFRGQLYEGGEPTNGAPYAIKGLSLLGLATFNPPVTSESGQAQATTAAPVGHQAHEGFHASASLGPGWLWVSGAPPEQLSGRGTALALSAGYGFANHLVAFGEFSETKVNGPQGATEDAVEWYGVGPGLRYYLLPTNVFFSGSLLLSKAVRSYPSPGSEGATGAKKPSGWGLMGRMSVGKTWWLLGHLGVGAAAEVGLGKMAGNSDWSTVSVKQLALLASVSFN